MYGMNVQPWYVLQCYLQNGNLRVVVPDIDKAEVRAKLSPAYKVGYPPRGDMYSWGCMEVHLCKAMMKIHVLEYLAALRCQSRLQVDGSAHVA
jgi:hypothetical protein